MQGEFFQPLGDGALAPRQEGGAHPVGHLAQPQIEAGRLHLIGLHRLGGRDVAFLHQAADHMGGQNAVRRPRRCVPVCGHGARTFAFFPALFVEKNAAGRKGG